MKEIKPIELVLSVVDPLFPCRFNFESLINDKLLVKNAIKLADRNGLYYCFMSKLKKLNLDQSFFHNSRWNDENHNLQGFISTLNLLEEISSNYGLKYVVIKACTKYPHVPRDVDIFVRKEDIKKFVSALDSKGIKCTHSDGVDTSLTNGKNIKIDIYTGLCYFTGDFIGPDFLWNSCAYDTIFDARYVGLMDNANFLVMLIHSLFGHRCLSLLDFLHLRTLLSSAGQMSECRNYAYSRGWGYSFDAVVAEINNINHNIMQNKNLPNFPYLFNRSFVLDCISKIEGLEMTPTNKLFLEISLAQDFAVYNLKETKIYNLMKSCNLTRKMFNSVGYFIRNMRGDKRSG